MSYEHSEEVVLNSPKAMIYPWEAVVFLRIMDDNDWGDNTLVRFFPNKAYFATAPKHFREIILFSTLTQF